MWAGFAKARRYFECLLQVDQLWAGGLELLRIGHHDAHYQAVLAVVDKKSVLPSQTVAWYHHLMEKGVPPPLALRDRGRRALSAALEDDEGGDLEPDLPIASLAHGEDAPRALHA